MFGQPPYTGRLVWFISNPKYSTQIAIKRCTSWRSFDVFLVNCLNGHLYVRSIRHKDEVLGNDDDTDPEYHLQTGQSNNNLDVNITLKPENL